MSLSRECKSQRFLLKLKKKSFFSQEDFEKVYPNGSFVARVYGLPKLHKLKSKSDNLKVRPIVSSINTYNLGFQTISYYLV